MPDRDADTRAAGVVIAKLICAPLRFAVKVVVGEIDRHLLRAGNVGRDLHRKRRAGAVLVWPATRRFFVEYLRELGRVCSSDGKEDGLADFARERVALGVVEEAADKAQVCFVREELPLVVLLAEDELGLLSVFVRRNSHHVAFVRKHLRRDVGARVESCRVDRGTAGRAEPPESSCSERSACRRRSQTCDRCRAATVARIRADRVAGLRCSLPSDNRSASR